MPYYCSYADDGKALLRRGVGIVTGEELLVVARKQARDEQGSRGIHYCFIDFSEVEKFEVMPCDVQNMAQLNLQLLSFAPPCMPVVVVAKDSLVRGMSRVWNSWMGDAIIFHLVGTRREAMAWMQAQLVTRAGSSEVLELYPFLQQQVDD